jgi:hypothetical protein
MGISSLAVQYSTPFSSIFLIDSKSLWGLVIISCGIKKIIVFKKEKGSSGGYFFMS